MDDGNALKNYQTRTGRHVWGTGEIIDSVIADLSNENIDVLFIPGDMTLNGEKLSHTDFVRKLEPLMQKGTKVFVIPGNHDVNIPNPLRFEGNNSYPADNVSAAEFESIYYGCGYGSAIKRDTASLSYVAQLDDNKWLLAIDGSLYKEYTNIPLPAGRIPAATEKWIIEALTEAKEKNMKVIGMMHHGLVEHVVLQDMLLPQYLIDDWRRLAALFADNGLKFIFTGHFHSHDISEFISDAGNKIYDIETGSLQSYPYPYRIINITNKEMDIATRNVKSISSNPDLFTQGRLFLKDQIITQIKQRFGKKLNHLPGESIDRIVDLGSEIAILHIQGDEVLNDDTKQQIKALAKEADIPVDLSPEFLQLDFPPGDNNVTLPF